MTEEKQISTNLLNPSIWIRLVFMAIVALLLVVARVVIWVVALLQFLMVLITARDNDNLRDLGQGLSKWAYQGHLFLTFNSEEKPFPFSDWPVVETTEPYEASSEEEPEKSSSGETDLDDSDVPSFTEEPEESAGDKPTKE